MPVAADKTKGPATSIFLGIEIDTQAGQLRLPREKLSDLMATLQSWTSPDRPHIQKRSGTKRDLLSLSGKLHHASRVIKPGRAFIRSLIDTSIAVTSLYHHVSLKADARADIAWWSSFISIWNWVTLIPPMHMAATIVSDASGSWGCEAVCNEHWFQLAWPGSWVGRNSNLPQGTGTNCGGSGPLGTLVERKNDPMILR